MRVWDFPRLQLALLGIIALAAWIAGTGVEGWGEGSFAAVVGLAAAFQSGQVWRYTRLAPREVQEARAADRERRITLLMSNVLQTNREAARLLATIREIDPDIILCVETDDWWEAQLRPLEETHPHGLRCPLPNTYGMLLYSRLPLEEPRIEFLLEPDIPSMHAAVKLHGGVRVSLHCVHPRPPVPGESDDSLMRDAELLRVAERVSKITLPTIVCGDLNDVAWSRTTRLFQKVSRLVDPRKGRGFFATFHARWPGFRYPLDHVFHSDDFRLVSIRRLGYVGSDHFPVCLTLSHEPAAAAEQEAPEADHEDRKEARETIQEGIRESRAG